MFPWCSILSEGQSRSILGRSKEAVSTWTTTGRLTLNLGAILQNLRASGRALTLSAVLIGCSGEAPEPAAVPTPRPERASLEPPQYGDDRESYALRVRVRASRRQWKGANDVVQPELREGSGVLFARLAARRGRRRKSALPDRRLP